MCDNDEACSDGELHVKKRVPHNFGFSLIYHLIECFDVQDPLMLLNEIIDATGNLGRDAIYGKVVYFGGFKNFKRTLVHHVWLIHKVEHNMSASDIALKYGVSVREVHRGIKCPGSSK